MAASLWWTLRSDLKANAGRNVVAVHWIQSLLPECFQIREFESAIQPCHDELEVWIEFCDTPDDGGCFVEEHNGTGTLASIRPEFRWLDETAGTVARKEGISELGIGSVATFEPWAARGSIGNLAGGRGLVRRTEEYEPAHGESSEIDGTKLAAKKSESHHSPESPNNSPPRLPTSMLSPPPFSSYSVSLRATPW